MTALVRIYPVVSYEVHREETSININLMFERGHIQDNKIISSFAANRVNECTSNRTVLPSL